MAPSEPLTPVVLGPADLMAAVALSDGARWNQTVDDWRHFVSSGRAIGLRTARSELVASTALLPYAGGQAWISMVLVRDDWQHRGLATRLVNDAVDLLKADGLLPVLDATPAGRAVYERLGFVAGFGFARWEGEAGSGAGAADAANNAPGAADDAPGADRVVEAERGSRSLDAVAALDQAVSGLGRRPLLDAFLSRGGSRLWFAGGEGRPEGFAIRREGRGAWQIGPVVAHGASQAIALVRAALAGLAGRVFIDVPAGCEALQAWLGARGFRLQRPFTRMALAASAPPNVAHADARLFAVAGPEFG